MDNVIKVRRSFLNEIRGLCNCLAGLCEGCFRRPCNCEFYDLIQRAKFLIIRIDNIRDAEEERFFIENPAEEYMARVIKAIAQGGGKPVRSQNIVIPGESRQRKAKALKSLVKRGRVNMQVVNGERFYTVANAARTTTTNSNRN